MKTLRSILLLVIVTAMTLPAAAQGWGDGPRDRAQRPNQRQAFGNERIMQMIPDLTDDQLAQIQELHLNARVESREHMTYLAKMRIDMQSMTRAESPDKKAIYALMNKMQAERTALQKIRIDTRLQVREVLTDQQRKIFDTMGPVNLMDGRRGQGMRGNGPCQAWNK